MFNIIDTKIGSDLCIKFYKNMQKMCAYENKIIKLNLYDI